MTEEKRMTAPVSSALHKESLSSQGALAKGFHYVGADEGQSLNQHNDSITDKDAEYKKKLLEIQRFRLPTGCP